MKNIIFILADGMCDYFLDKKIGGIDVCPNIKKLADTGYRFTNVYSQAPYTMAALTPVLSQNDSLNDHNYEAVLGGKSRLIYDDLIDNGYDIFGAFYCDLLFPSRILKEFNYRWPILLERFMFMELPYIQYYTEYLRGYRDDNSSRDKETLSLLIKCFFDSSKLFLSDQTWNGITEQFRKSPSFPWDNFICVIKSESDRYYTNQENYVDELIEHIDSNRLFSKEFVYDTAEFLDADFCTHIKDFYIEYKNIFKYLYRKQIYLNLYNSKIECIKILSHLVSDAFLRRLQTGNAKKELIQFFMRIRNFSFSYDSFMSTNMISTTGDPSAGSQLNKLRKSIIEKKCNNKPYFAFAHLMDTHQPFNFFTAEDVPLCRSEMNDHIELIKSIKRDEWRGNLAYLFAAHYVDRCIGTFLSQLSCEGALNNSLVVFCSDHGLQYGDSPIRDKTQGENYNWESYHIPCVIKDYSNNDCKTISTFFSSKNIFPTVFELADMKIQKQSNCVNMLVEGDAHLFANMEYLGPGQPDIYRKKIIYGLRDDCYYLVCKVPLNSDVSEEHIEAIYDLKNDPYEMKNKKKSLYNNRDIIDMMDVIRKRHMEVREEYLFNDKIID